MVIDTAVNRQIFEFRTNGIYKNSEFNLTGHGNWAAPMNKNILEMVSYQGFANEYKNFSARGTGVGNNRSRCWPN